MSAEEFATEPGSRYSIDPVTGEMSDGYHTFGELYAHRRALTAALVKVMPACWRSKNHHPEDDPMFDGYFIIGMTLPTGAITYHYKLKYWKDFSHVAELRHAPKWDGATPDDTVVRLMTWANSGR